MSPRRAPEPPSGVECCVHHTFERAERMCRDCGHWLCDQCIVTPWGPCKAALCIDCAIGRGGVRSTAPRPAVRSDREIRKLDRQLRDDDLGTALSAASAAALFRATPLVRSDDEEPAAKRSLFRRHRPDG